MPWNTRDEVPTSSKSSFRRDGLFRARMADRARSTVGYRQPGRKHPVVDRNRVVQRFFSISQRPKRGSVHPAAAPSEGCRHRTKKKAASSDDRKRPARLAIGRVPDRAHGSGPGSGSPPAQAGRSAGYLPAYRRLIIRLPQECAGTPMHTGAQLSQTDVNNVATTLQIHLDASLLNGGSGHLRFATNAPIC